MPRSDVRSSPRGAHLLPDPCVQVEAEEVVEVTSRVPHTAVPARETGGGGGEEKGGGGEGEGVCG